MKCANLHLVVLVVTTVLAFANAANFTQTFTGTTSAGYTQVSLGKYQTFADGATLTLVGQPEGCYTGCFSDIAPAYSDQSAWSFSGFCKLVLTDDGTPQTSFVRQENLHLVLYQTQQQCQYEITLSGNQCAQSLYGPECQARVSAPSDSIILEPGQSFTFEGAYNNERFAPSVSYVRVSYYGDGGENETAYIAGRAYDFPRFSPDIVADSSALVNVNEDSASYTLELATPPRLFEAYSQNQRIPIFFSVYAPPTNNGTVTFNIESVNEDECPINFQAGRNCEYYTPIIYDGYVYNYTLSEVEDIAFLIEVGQTSFSFGLMALEGNVLALLRYGNVPSPAVHDIAIPAAQAENTVNQVRYYNGGSNIDLQEAPWYLVFVSSDPPPTNPRFFWWLNSECPKSCSGHGTCSQSRCICDSGYPGPICSTDENQDSPTGLPAADGLTSAGVFFIVWSLLMTLGLIGLWAYLHNRRRQAVYNSL